MAITSFYSQYGCDTCGRMETTTRKYEAPNNWLVLVQHSQEYSKPPDDVTWHFCTWECLKQFPARQAPEAKQF